MAVHKKDLALFTAQLQALKDDIPEIMDTIAVGEGVYAVKQARLICKNDPSEPKQEKLGIANTGDYRRNWKSDRQARRSGKKYIVRFYNPLDYAGHLEHGFRSHFVPGKYLSGTVRTAHPDGIQVGTPGSYVRGHFTMKRAVKVTLKNQEARVGRKIEKEIKQRMK